MRVACDILGAAGASGVFISFFILFSIRNYNTLYYHSSCCTCRAGISSIVEFILVDYQIDLEACMEKCELEYWGYDVEKCNNICAKDPDYLD